ncbi:uncharacterized protein LOC142163526 [Nicotiana tabacum]|uniref:Uncharacterized protein LOC142163526 n=1 Tax=Nicotiana tabacum TaxID=4097 RepID=A0AC58RW49_TOBAC
MRLYVMKNFVVGPNNLKIKTNKHKLKLTFPHRTSVDEISDPQFSLNIFNFKPFQHLTNQVEVDENELFGEVIGHGNVESYNQGGKTRGPIFQQHFWGEFVEEILSHVDGSPNQRVIVVMQLIKAHKFQDKYSVRNTFHSSKLWINPDLPQVAEFISSGREVNLERFSQTTSQRNYSVFEELAAGNVEVKSIGELIDFLQEGQIWIVATIVNLELERGWSYVGCKKCSKKFDKIRNKFYCKKCERVDYSALKRGGTNR